MIIILNFLLLDGARIWVKIPKTKGRVAQNLHSLRIVLTKPEKFIMHTVFIGKRTNDIPYVIRED